MVFPGVQSLDVTGPFEVFSRGRAGRRSIGVIAASLRRGGGRPQARTGDDQQRAVPAGLRLCRVRGRTIDTLVLAGGEGVDGACRRHRSWWRSSSAAAARARRVATVCSGALLAAEAGLLDGRRATTHWARADELARRFPAVEVDADPIYLRDGRVWTSAGVTAGIDLALALVEEDLGTEVAQIVARWLVMFLHRPGGQTQFATPVWTPAGRPVPGPRRAVTGSRRRPATTTGWPPWPGAAAMSERHFTRVFTAEVGETPSRYVERVRTEAARRDLRVHRRHPRRHRRPVRIRHRRDPAADLPPPAPHQSRRLPAPVRRSTVPRSRQPPRSLT